MDPALFDIVRLDSGDQAENWERPTEFRGYAVDYAGEPYATAGSYEAAHQAIAATVGPVTATRVTDDPSWWPTRWTVSPAQTERSN